MPIQEFSFDYIFIVCQIKTTVTINEIYLESSSELLMQYYNSRVVK